MTKKKKYPIIQVSASGKPNWAAAHELCVLCIQKITVILFLKDISMKLENIWKRILPITFVISLYGAKAVVEDIGDFGKIKPFIFLIHLKFAKEWKYRVTKYEPSDGYGYYASTKKEQTVLKFKRMPKRWIPEFNEL